MKYPITLNIYKTLVPDSEEVEILVKQEFRISFIKVLDEKYEKIHSKYLHKPTKPKREKSSEKVFDIWFIISLIFFWYIFIPLFIFLFIYVLWYKLKEHIKYKKELR
jgi:hypothetical protein